MKQTNKKILVLGATGKTGSRIMRRLNEAGHSAVAGSRSAATPFDWEREETWRSALDGISSVYISYQPDLAAEGAMEVIQNFTRLAVEKGVKQFVLLSGRGEKEAQECEDIVITSGIDWTILRASWFFQNFSESYLLDPILAGYVALPVSEVGEPFIDAEDIADVAVASFTDAVHNRRIYELTGPRLLSFRQAIDEISVAMGRNINFKNISIKDYSKQLETFEVPAEIIRLMEYLFTHVLDGRNEKLGNGLQMALGREPADFSNYITKTILEGTWEK